MDENRTFDDDACPRCGEDVADCEHAVEKRRKQETKEEVSC